MKIFDSGLARTIMDIIGVDPVRASANDFFALVACMFLICTLSLFLVFLFKLLVYIKKR